MNRRQLAAAILFAMVISLNKQGKLDQKQSVLLATIAVLFLSRYSASRQRKIERQQVLYQVLMNADDTEFYREFRMTLEVFSELLRRIDQHAVFTQPQRPGKMKLDARLSLAVFLHRMAHNTSVGQIASRFGISEGSVVNCFHRTLESVLDALKDEVSWPDQQRREIIKDGFIAMGSLPGAVGAVDGSHLRLQSKPQGVPNPLAYYCRHDHYSINLMVICDHEKNVIDFSAGYPGACHDSAVFKSSAFYRDISQRLSRYEFILADSAYSLEENVMKPFPQTTSNRSEVRFNAMLSRGRVRIEHTFGLLKQKWKIIDPIKVVDRETTLKIIRACLYLHNFLNRSNSPYDLEDDTDIDQDVFNEPETDQQRYRAGTARRTLLLNEIVRMQ